MPTKKAKCLTPRERALFKNIIKGMSITDAALAAGYSRKWPGQAGFQALKSIQEKATDLFERHGLDDDTFIEKHIKPALRARQTKCFLYVGKIVYSKPLIAWAPRVQMIQLITKMKGMIREDAQQSAPGVKVVIVNAQNRPRRPAIDASPTLPTPMLGIRDSAGRLVAGVPAADEPHA
jgi:hypothetical protein